MTYPDDEEETVFRGEYTSPDGSYYVEEVSGQSQANWLAYLPSVIAVINSGALDEQIYEIARACHARHLVTHGKATDERPERPTNGASPVPTPVGEPSTAAVPFRPKTLAELPAYKVLSENNPLESDPTAMRYFTVNGKRYGKLRAVGNFFVVPAVKNFPIELQGALVEIEDCATTMMTVRIHGVVRRSFRSAQVGDRVKIHYVSVPALFK